MCSSSHGLDLRRGKQRISLPWPPRPVVAKLEIPALVGFAARGLTACPTLRLAGQAQPPWLPGCLKPDQGQGGEGFSPFRSARAFTALRQRRRGPWVVQPLLVGQEYRISVCADGTFAAAALIDRTGGRSGEGPGDRSLWRDATPRFSRPLLTALLAVVTRLSAPGLGFDLLRIGRRWVLLDINVNPSLAIHLATDHPRNLAPAFLRSWLKGRRAHGCRVPPRAKPR